MTSSSATAARASAVAVATGRCRGKAQPCQRAQQRRQSKLIALGFTREKTPAVKLVPATSPTPSASSPRPTSPTTDCKRAIKRPRIAAVAAADDADDEEDNDGVARVLPWGHPMRRLED